MTAYDGRIFYKSCEDMSEIPDGVVQTCVTSPPYFGLRDYGIDGQIGLEETVEAYVARLVGVFREVRRVLRDDGVLFLNLGDSYAGSWGAQGRGPEPASGYGTTSALSATSIAAHPKRRYTGTIRDSGLKPKDLIGVPWRVAFALQSDGWWLRSDIIWHKPNPMPSSVTDRCTSAHEYVFMLSKSARYFFDADAISEPSVGAGEERVPSESSKNSVHENRTYRGLARRVTIKENRNKRDVWTIATALFADAHFATFPPELPALCIRAGSRPGDLILDPFMGSGTTAEVATALGRRWTGYELNPAYQALIAKRTCQLGLLARSIPQSPPQ